MTTLCFSEHADADWPHAAVAAVDNGLNEANAAAAPLHEVRKLACLAHGDAGQLLGGAIGRTWGGVAELQMLWVAPAQRRQGLGARLIANFEAAARQRACTLVILETHSFQAPQLYAAAGYVAVHTNADFPHGQRKFLMEKRLGPGSAHSGLRIRRLQDPAAAAGDPRVPTALADLLADAVDSGASVGFMAPLAPAEALGWAQQTLANLGPGLVLWLAEQDGLCVGTVQLGPCLKPNGRHRAEVMKLLVHRQARGQGIARQLLAAVDNEARDRGLRLLVLDTLVGSDAEAIYRHLGWQPYGRIPDYALTPTGEACATAGFYKQLG